MTQPRPRAAAHRPRRPGPHLLLLLAILALAAGFRFTNLDWDSGSHQHPDDRFLTIVGSEVKLPASLADYFATARSSLNPYAIGQERFAYGQLPLTLTRAVAEAVGMQAYDRIYLVGRFLSALADLGTVLFAWLLARRVFGLRVAHLAAALLALAVLPIQLAHFYAVDTYVAFFAAASLSFGQRAWQRDRLADAALAGALAGLATASKISALALLPVLVLAFLWPRQPLRQVRWRAHLLDAGAPIGVALLAAAAAFRVAEPYAFLGPSPLSFRPNPVWFADKAYWAQISAGQVDVPYMIQWAGTAPYLFVLQGLVQWGLGPALGLASLAGLVFFSWRFARARALAGRESLLLLAWTVLNLVYFGGQFAKFLRYLLPVYFALAILAAALLVWLVERARPGRLRAAALALAATVVALTAGWALAFSQVYAQPHARIQASEWIYANVPPGAVLATEHWDDRPPMALPGRDGRQYRFVELTLYDPENAAKREKLLQALDQADYVILASRRLADSIPRLPERYPLATAYYRLLFSGQLGFERAAKIQVAPSLGPFTVDDSRAQEDFTVYDHPTVEVWAKRPDYDAAAVRQALAAVPLDRVVNVRAVDAGKGALLLSEQERQAAVAGGTWRALFDRDSLANRLPVLAWLVAAEALALSAVPLLWRLLPFLPDRGFGLSKIAALALVAYAAWLPASLKLLPFGRGSLALAWALLLLASAAAAWQRREALRAWLRRERWLLLAVELVFLLGSGLFLAIRAQNPDLWHPVWGGEKPMNFAYLNAVVKSDFFPPYDPWFAGGSINYYYFGSVLVAALVKLTGILPQVAFNLAQPTFFGALCALAFSLAFNLSVPARRLASRASAYLAGSAAVLLVGLLGNLDAGLQVLDQLGALGGQRAPGAGAGQRVLAGLQAVVFGGQPMPPLDFWRSTRFIGPEDPGPIHEFPYFTWLYGDLHAHQLALPLTLAVLLVSLQLVRAARHAPTRVPWGALALGGLLVGLLRATNTWDFPTYAGIAVLSLGLGYLPGLLRASAPAWRACLLSVVALLGLSQALFLPYLQRYQLFYTSMEPVKARTALSQFLTIHGLFFFLGASLFAWYAARALRRLAAERRPRAVVGPDAGLAPSPTLAAAESPPNVAPETGATSYYGMLLPTPPGLARIEAASPALWALGLGALLAVALLLGGYPTRALLVLGIAAASSVALACWRRASRAFQAGLVAVALAAALLPEIVALQGDVGRMNTLFKFYLQAWALLAVATAVGLGWLARHARRDPLLRAWRLPWLLLLALLVAAAASYPLFASQTKIRARFADLPLTLDGMAYMDVARYLDKGVTGREQDLNLPGDARAIRWLQDTVDGSPTILEGRAPLYRWGSRVSIYTGLPTVLGWDWHQIQQRAAYSFMVQERAADVQRAYDSPDPADLLAVIQTYDVRYVYVGGLERAYYAAAGLRKLSAMPRLRLVYDQAGVQIYEVVT